MRPGRAWGLLALVIVFGACGDDDSSNSESAATEGGDASITREELGQASPAGAPGQVLYLQRVTIDPGARLDTHYHDGTQVAHIAEGTLTYVIVEGSVEVTREDGDVETFTAPDTISLSEGDGLVETRDLVHYGSNETDTPVVVLLSALLADGAPLATPLEE